MHRFWGRVRWLAALLMVVLSSGVALASPASMRDPVSAGALGAQPSPPGDAPHAHNLSLANHPPPKDYNTVDRQWVRFSYHPSTREHVEPLITQADAVRDQLREMLGARVLDRVEVRIARTPREMRSLAPEAAQVPSYAAGLAFSDAGLVLLTIKPLHANSHHDLAEIFKHELVHIALHDAVGGRPIPRWFNEGLAVYASGENRASRLWALWSATLSENLMYLRELDRGFPANPADASIAYAQAADIVRFLLRGQDEQRFRAAIARYRGGQSFEGALSDAYGTDLATLEFEWREDVARRYTFWPVLFSGTVVWVGAFGLLLWAWRVRSRRNQRTLERWAREEAQDDLRRRVTLETNEPRVHIVLSRSAEPELPTLETPIRETDVPKVEHDGRWHTLH